MQWYKLAQPTSDPFAFREPMVTKAPKSPKGPRITFPQREWSPPLDPEDVVIPPPSPNKGALVNEIMKMVSGVEVEKLVALRDKLRGEGFWKGLMSEPGPGKAKETEESPLSMAKSPKEEIQDLEEPGPYEAPAKTPEIQRLRERFKEQPPPAAKPLPGQKPLTDYETRLRGQSSQ